MPYCSTCGTPEQPDQQFCAQCGTATGQGSKSQDSTVQATGHDSAGLGPMPYFPMDEPDPAPTQPLASYWWRVLGYVVDAIILGVVISVPLRALSINVYVAAVAAAVLTFFYGTLMLALARGQTLGMMVARVRCVNLTDSALITQAQAVKRTALYCALSLFGNWYHYAKYVHPSAVEKVAEGRHALLGLAFLLPFILDLLWPLWDKQRQTLHDKFARTVVVRPAKSPAPLA